MSQHKGSILPNKRVYGQYHQNTGNRTYLHTGALRGAFEPCSFSTDLMIPTATVCFRSLAAKRPVEGRDAETGTLPWISVTLKLVLYLEEGM